MTPQATTRVRVRSSRYDGSPRDDVEAELVDARDGVFRVRIHAGTPNQTPRGVIAEVATATQLLFSDRWYNVNHFHDVVAPYSNLWYANLAMPAEFDGAEVRWTDLDLDVMCDVERGLLLKDVEIFERRAASGYYPDDVVRKVLATRNEILALADSGAFPFDRDVQIAG